MPLHEAATTHEVPTRAQVQAALAASRSGRPVRPLDDIEAAKRAGIAAGVAAMRKHEARTRASLDRFCAALVPLWGREIKPGERAMLSPIVADLAVLLGPMPADPGAAKKRS